MPVTLFRPGTGALYFASQLFQKYSRGAVRNSPFRSRRATVEREVVRELDTAHFLVEDGLEPVDAGFPLLQIHLDLQLPEEPLLLLTLHVLDDVTS